jgi:hypothetical protein
MARRSRRIRVDVQLTEQTPERLLASVKIWFRKNSTGCSTSARCSSSTWRSVKLRVMSTFDTSAPMFGVTGRMVIVS